MGNTYMLSADVGTLDVSGSAPPQHLGTRAAPSTQTL
jgi:hypothetical protein